MVSFSCENCGDVLTKKKLDGHRNQCYGASYTCLDCMIHFEGNAYKSHTSCVSEAQKYQGKLYKEKKPKQQHQKKDSAQQDYTSQALVPRNAYVEDAPDADTGAVAIVDAPPRAPSPPPAAYSLGYSEPAAIEDVNVFDFLETAETPNASRVQFPESHMIEDSQPPAYEEEPPTQPDVTATDVLKFQVPYEDEHHYAENGFTYGNEPIHPTSERHESTYNLRPQESDYNFTTPAPKPKHSRTKSRDKDYETTTQKADRKRKRNSPSELDLTEARAMQQRDIIMAEDPPSLHSGLTGGLNRLLTRPEFPPSPDYSGDYVENSPLSPMKRAKQGASKAFARAQKEYETQKEKDRKAEIKAQMAREKEEKKERERGRDRERKERKVSTALVKIKPKVKRRDDSALASRRQREGERRRRRQYSSSPSPEPERRTLKAIEYHRSDSHSPAPEQNGNSAMIVRPNGDLAPMQTGVEARANLFMSFINKGPESERGMSVNKALKRYHRERFDRWDREIGKAEEEKELWKSLRLKRNDRGEVVVFFAQPDA
ncbi:hypothetical protein K505DRAFT_278352 [Melanomma pulvis-pyrius CBS 109.77]|uniref:Zinc finger C2H2 LYAR-type domain-containing protein n=1 Tax=Melanomma pulvis-pyrius CBS 109.77 TaxID=1314802 RepID=A0A6A6X9G9_9PLEO|nr:hypothetical protein K505DRAFT_278352 [Melanomma pulvis-pyrius CBS 109.77]